jgi:hypothetical protein
MVDVSLVPEAAWREAQRRADVIRPLTEHTHRARHLVRAGAATLGLSERQTYTILRRCREAGGDLTALLPGKSSGGRDKRRVAPANLRGTAMAEALEAIADLDLTALAEVKPPRGYGRD